MQLFKIIVVATAVSAANLKERTGSGGCNRDNCLRAVQGTAKGPAQVEIAKTDCSSFLEVTTTVPSRLVGHFNCFYRLPKHTLYPICHLRFANLQFYQYRNRHWDSHCHPPSCPS